MLRLCNKLPVSNVVIQNSKITSYIFAHVTKATFASGKKNENDVLQHGISSAELEKAKAKFLAPGSVDTDLLIESVRKERQRNIESRKRRVAAFYSKTEETTEAFINRPKPNDKPKDKFEKFVQMLAPAEYFVPAIPELEETDEHKQQANIESDNEYDYDQEHDQRFDEEYEEVTPDTELADKPVTYDIEHEAQTFDAGAEEVEVLSDEQVAPNPTAFASLISRTTKRVSYATREALAKQLNVSIDDIPSPTDDEAVIHQKYLALQKNRPKEINLFYDTTVKQQRDIIKAKQKREEEERKQAQEEEIQEDNTDIPEEANESKNTADVIFSISNLINPSQEATQLDDDHSNRKEDELEEDGPPSWLTTEGHWRNEKLQKYPTFDDPSYSFENFGLIDFGKTIKTFATTEEVVDDLSTNYIPHSTHVDGKIYGYGEEPLESLNGIPIGGPRDIADLSSASDSDYALDDVEGEDSDDSDYSDDEKEEEEEEEEKTENEEKTEADDEEDEESDSMFDANEENYSTNSLFGSFYPSNFDYLRVDNPVDTTGQRKKVQIVCKGFIKESFILATNRILETAKLMKGIEIEGPIPMPTKRERLILLKSPFKYKKAYASFSKKTHQRMFIITANAEVCNRFVAISKQLVGSSAALKVIDFSYLPMNKFYTFDKVYSKQKINIEK